MSTVDADTSSKICEAVTSKGGYFLEAPVSGSKKPAEDGQLVILAAGEKAYKRVGSMIHNGDSGRGVIGVIDVTGLMKDDDGLVWVHNNKQGFQDCEVYAELEKWLGVRTDEYLDKYVNKLQLMSYGKIKQKSLESYALISTSLAHHIQLGYFMQAKGIAIHKPDHEWCSVTNVGNGECWWLDSTSRHYQ